jgi:virginiamycin B lyase
MNAATATIAHHVSQFRLARFTLLSSAVAGTVLAVVAWHIASWPGPDIVEHRMLEPTDIPAALVIGPDGAAWFTIELSDSIGLLRGEEMARIAKGQENFEALGLAVDAAGHLWYTESLTPAIERMATDGTVESFKLPTPIARFGRLAIAPDGAVWFADGVTNSFTRFKDGRFTPYRLPTPDAMPFGVAVGADGTVWGTEQAANKLVRISPDGQIVETDVPTRRAIPGDIAVDTSGAVWFLELNAGKIGRFADGQFFEFDVPSASPGLVSLAVAPDGSVWFTELVARRLGRLRDGAITEIPLSRDDARPFGIAVDAEGNVWYTDLSGRLGMLPAARAQARFPWIGWPR